MALQGTIDAFPLVDVLQLLASSGKTGRLVIEGDRGTGHLWVLDGALVGGEAPTSTQGEPVQLVFEVLRFSEGSFLFEPGGEPSGPTFDGVDIPALLDGARQLLEEWTAIVDVVPSSAHRVSPVRELPEDDGPVRLDRDEWAAIVAAGSGADMATLASELGLGEFDAARRVAALVGRGLVVVDEPRASDLLPATLDPIPEPAPSLPEPVPGDPLLAEDPLLGGEVEAEPFPDRFPIDDLLGDDGDSDDAWSPIDPEGDRADRFAAGGAFEDRVEAVPLNGEDRPAADAWPSEADAVPDQGFADPGFADPAFGETAFSDPGFADPAVPDPAFEETAFSDPAFSDRAAVDPAGFHGSGLPEAASTAAAPVAPDPTIAEPGTGPPPSDGTDEVLRQMSRLSPKAAEAIAAALGTASESDGEPPTEGGSAFLQSF